jgi:tetratricopeptide (TPR) repeat protein
MMKNSYWVSAVNYQLKNFWIRLVRVVCQLTTTVCLLTVALVLPRAAWAVVEAGGSQSPFELGGSARILGMGGAAAALSGDGDSFFENPATLATLNQHEILTFHSSLLVDTIYDSVGYVNPIGAHNSFGIAIARLGTSNILETQNNIQAISTFSSEQLQGLVGYGFEAVNGLDFGATVKYLRQQVDTFEASGVGVDAGLLYHFSKNREDFSHIGYRNITLGLSVSNALQSQAKLVQLPDEPARIFRPALSYFFQSSNNCLWLAFEGQVTQDGNTLIKAGAEYGWNNTLYGRAGFDGVSPTLGAGLRLYGFEFDYAFNQRDLGALHRFSLTYRFGQYNDPLQAQKIDLLKWVANSYSKGEDYGPAIQAWQNVLKEFPGDEEASSSIQSLKEKREKAVKDQLGIAKEAIARGNYEKALPLLAKIINLDPGNPEAKELLKTVDQKMLVSTDYMRGVESYSKEDYGSAIQYLKLVYEMDPQYRDVKFLYHDAESHYMPLESMSKELTDLYAKGVDYYMGGHYQKAVDVWEKVLEKSPNNFLVRRNLEEARSRLKDEPQDNLASPNQPDSKDHP